MPQPLPKKPLGTHCSAIKDNVLYTFSEDAFQSLSLTNGSKWETLPHGVGTKGAACVLAKVGTADEALYIVGGVTKDSSKNSASGFMGLQRWIFGRKKWETVELADPVTENLINHGAAFLSSTEQIIVFAGTKYPTDDTPSANTYLINTINQEVLSIPAKTPLLSPLVLQWGTDGALVIGGNSGNTNLLTYSPSLSWSDLSMDLDVSIPAKGNAGASLMDGDDGSRMLYTYDFTTSPVSVHQKVVLEAGGKRVKRASGANPASSTQTTLTASDWPTYNKTGAPTGSRTNAAVAYAGGTVVMSGGDDKEPLVMFNQAKNSWVDTEQVLDADPKESKIRVQSQSSSRKSSSSTASATKSSVESSSSVSSTVPTVSSSATGTAAAGSTGSSGAGGDGLTTVQLLFVVLGSILGAAILLACIFFFLKKRRERRTLLLAKGGRRERLSFQDRGASFMKEAGGSVSPHTASFQRPFADRSSNTDSWTAVQHGASGINGLNGGAAPINSYSTGGYNNDGPTVQAIGGQGVIVNPGMNGIHPGDRGMAAPVFGKERSSGWSRYFSGNSATNLVGAGGIQQSNQPSNMNYVSTAHSSTYTDATPFGTQKGLNHHPNPYLHNAGPGIAAGGIVGGVAAGTALTRSASDGPERMTGERRGSEISMSSIGGDSFSSGIPESINTEKPIWSPVGDSYGDDRDSERFRGPIASSVYPESPSVVMADDRRDTEISRYSGPPTPRNDGVDNLSWLNLRAN